MATRTNNAAESVHALMNQEVNGKLLVLGFLKIVEEQMDRTNQRIAYGCKSETRAVEGEKNRLLAVELHKLLNGDHGILNYLDNCGLVIKLKSIAEARTFVTNTISPSMISCGNKQTGIW